MINISLFRKQDFLTAFAPLKDLEHGLHYWVAFFIMLVFALSNAGVMINTDMNLDYSLLINIGQRLFIGKLVGITETFN